jgi:hypothetical protein
MSAFSYQLSAISSSLPTRNADRFLAHPFGNKYTAIDVTTIFPNAIGNMTFQPNFMS